MTATSEVDVVVERPRVWTLGGPKNGPLVMIVGRPAPVVALIGLRATNPRYLGIFDSVTGQMVLIGCAASVALGYAAMLYLTRLPGQRRVLIR